MTDVGRFAALAVAHRAANAVGPVSLGLEPTGLRLQFAGVRPHLRGFALGGEAQHVTLEVPYSALRGIVREGRVLLVSFDPRVLYPYNRFALVRFQRELPVKSRGTAFVAALVSFASWCVPLLGALLVGAAVRWAGENLLLQAVGAVASFVALAAVVRTLGQRVLWGGAASDRLRDELHAALSDRLGLGAGTVRVVEVADKTDGLEDALATVSRPRWLVPTLVFAVLGVLVTGAVVRRFGIAEFVRLPVADARTGIAAPATLLVEASRVALAPKHPECRCERADSTLWVDAPSKVALLVTPIRGDFDALWLRPEVVYSIKPGPRGRVELDLALVNGSASPLRDVSVVLTFWRSEGSERRNIQERGLAWARELPPGGSVKWRVRAQGDSMRITSYLPGGLEQGGFGPADAFAKLERANVTAVRLHGAMMLAYLGDARAEGAVRGLGRLSPLEERARAELASTFSPWLACDVRDGTVCVMNRSTALARRAELTDARGSTVALEDLFFPGRGLRVPFPGAQGPLVAAPR